MMNARLDCCTSSLRATIATGAFSIKLLCGGACSRSTTLIYNSHDCSTVVRAEGSVGEIVPQNHVM